MGRAFTLEMPGRGGVQGAGLRVCRVQGAGCRMLHGGCWVQGAGCWVLGAECWVLGAGCRVQGPGSRVQGPGSRVQAGCWVLGAECWVQGAGCRQGAECRVQVLGAWCSHVTIACISDRSISYSQFPHKDVDFTWESERKTLLVVQNSRKTPGMDRAGSYQIVAWRVQVVGRSPPCGRLRRAFVSTAQGGFFG